MPLIRMLLAAALFTGPASGTIIVGYLETASKTPNYSGTEAAESWTQTASYSNVQITANLLPTGIPLSAYLTTEIGPGTTVASEIASNSAIFPAGHGTLLFSGLTLGPGTYFLTIHSECCPELQGWQSSIPSLRVSDIGITASVYAFNTVAAYPPSSDIFSGPDSQIALVFDVRSVPEPSSSLIITVVMGLLTIALRRRSTSSLD